MSEKPNADHALQQTMLLFEDLVSAGEQLWCDGEALLLFAPTFVSRK